MSKPPQFGEDQPAPLLELMNFVMYDKELVQLKDNCFFTEAYIGSKLQPLFFPGIS